ncbi:GLUG motif-containing protein [Enterococcus mundtii]|uniref:GLUG motif-containing protein n=1 Tax=Enterococcus mundtii TaxID=53346 RepID=UPI0035C6F9E2
MAGVKSVVRSRGRNDDSPESENVGGLVGGHDFYGTVVDSYATGDVIGRRMSEDLSGPFILMRLVARNYSTRDM